MDILLKARQAAQETVANREERQDVLPILALQYKEQFENITDI